MFFIKWLLFSYLIPLFLINIITNIFFYNNYYLHGLLLFYIYFFVSGISMGLFMFNEMKEKRYIELFKNGLLHFFYSPFKIIEVMHSIYLADSFNLKMNIFIDLLISLLFPWYIGLFIIYNLIVENTIV